MHLRTRFRAAVGGLWVSVLAAQSLILLSAGPVAAGGSPENLLLIINPNDRQSMRVGNHYRLQRDVPDANVLYIVPTAEDYAAFAGENPPALFGTLANRALETHIDYILVTPGNDFFISAAGYINDGCSPVRRFSTSGVWYNAYLTDTILGGNIPSTRTNHYYTTTNIALAFDSRTRWFTGSPSTRADAERYFIGAMLGYTGLRGNTVAEVLDMIDRSVAVDGTFPTGTFYFMQTDDFARSSPRHGAYPGAVNTITAMGGQAEHRCCDPLPTGANDVMGIMTGIESIDIPGANMTIRPGAFCDHLTSFAGTFDSGAQTKMSRWIAAGASGTAGTVEEPCNYPGKFPHARLHVHYFSGLSLGEAFYRSLGFLPFQSLFIGDPLTRPFAHIPDVDVPDAPTQPVAGIITMTPRATTTDPFARIDGFDLLVNGVRMGSARRNGQFRLDTRRLADGHHDLRVLGWDDGPVRSTGRWIGSLTVDNTGRLAAISVSPTSGNLSTTFTINVGAGGGSVTEYRVLHQGRIVGSTTNPQNPVVLHGANLGAGELSLQTEALFGNGMLVRSRPFTITVSDVVGSPGPMVPTAFGYSRRVLSDQPFVLELPGAYNQFSGDLQYEIVSGPSKATIISTNDGPYRVIRPNPGASGADEVRFRWRSPSGPSITATITLLYDACTPGRMLLDVSRLRPGQRGVFTVTCGLPNEQTYLAYSTIGVGTTWVAQLGVRLDLHNPVQAGAARRTDSQGRVVWDLPIPNTSPRPVWFQTAQRGMVSNVVATEVR